MFGCAGYSLQHQLFSSCASGGYSLIVVHGVLMVVAFEVQLTNCWTLNGGQVWELISRRVQLKGWRGHIILRFSSRSLTRFPQQILGNSISKEMETTLDTPEYSSLLNKACPQEKLVNQSLIY